ncbi:response regulator [Caenimonas sp. SL110]|uniref:ATP-binding response regulator n=1 Tax=Caenimonas sp. SL110 TaxID=1450524 RepID=UPI001379300A|nr:hybrid sensor histidine kinase/response regulator [Caenimonas sp. SL110]
MTHWFSRIFSYYRAYHQPSPLLLRYMIVFGIVGLPAMYMLRFLRSPSTYDDILLRLFDVAILAVLALRAYWPDRAKPYYLHFSYFVMTVSLPMTFVFSSLMNGGGPGAVGNTFMAVFMLLLLTDWRNLIVMLLAGFGAAAGLYVMVSPEPRVPMDYVMRLPLLLISIIGGSVFKFALEQGAAERVRQAYASLAGSIAHEMRNPLAQVRHSLEQIRQSLPLPSARAQEQVIDAHSVEQLYRHVSQGETAVRRGLQVITMTLDEVNAKALNTERLSYASAEELCRKAVAEFGYEDEVQRSSVSVVVKRDFVFRADETAFLFVLFNLLKNALHYLPAYPGMHVRLEVDEGRICVTDTGPGIPAEALAELFQPFNTSGKSSGTGLGLAYCRRAVEAIGGKISCNCAPGTTSFVMEMPPVSREEIETGRERVFAQARREFANKLVLVVDDDAGIRASTRQLLLSLMCSVREAADGIEALQALRETKFDMVVLDLNMPRMDGYEIAESVRGQLAPLNRDTCLLAHTAEPEHVARVKTAKAGFDGFVAKPADPVAFIEALQLAVTQRASAPERMAGSLHDRTILVADDNAYNRMSVAGTLRHLGATVIEASDGEAVLALLSQGGTVDAVLLDLQMPRMGGMETARAIRSGAAGERRIPIIAITGYAGPQVIAEGSAAGISDFITKPVDQAALQSKLAQLLGLRTASAAPVVHAQAQEPVLLDEGRLANYLRLGMLAELVDDFVPRSMALVGQVRRASDARDMQAALDAMHSLVGMSGEGGAKSLHRYARELYVALRETGQWPAEDLWVTHLGELTETSNTALREWLRAQGAAAIG